MNLNTPEPSDDDVLAEMERQWAAEADGYTDRVRAQEAAVAEADRLRELPTARVLARQQALTELIDENDLATAELVARLEAAGERQRAQLAAKAAKAAALRRLATDPHVEALRLVRQRRAQVGGLWAALIFAMAVTAVNVQAFVAGDAAAWSPAWVVGWVLDPALSLLVVLLLLARGSLTGRALFAGRGKAALTLIEMGALISCLLMNVAPEIESRSPWGLIVGHTVMPLVALAATVAIPILQAAYTAAIDALSDPGNKIIVHPRTTARTGALTSNSSGPSRGSVQGVRPGSVGGPRGRSIEELRLALAAAVEADPDGVDLTSAESIRKALKCGKESARQLRDEFTTRPE